jgi:hypothetical protein
MIGVECLEEDCDGKVLFFLRLLHHSPKHIASCFSVSLIAVVEAVAVRTDNNHLGGQLLVFRLPFSIAQSQ